ncbi:hypothetical protein KIH74_02210 [Kineosporia sp. J2-2]|uniref:Uncharacterized protein n=1 Tax=Kineosporia corallincola TaxID=2835133 RepID=A0ABS5T9H1_9ACTN|nr:hypothetical protein [Kineosporia corallincola]MBT0767719.1 hypothetical protein [Kineosporia corallincola]
MDYVAAIFPSIGVLILFVIAIRAIFQADRRERLAQAAEDRRLGLGQNGPTGQTHTSQSVSPAESAKQTGTTDVD